MRLGLHEPVSMDTAVWFDNNLSNCVWFIVLTNIALSNNLQKLMKRVSLDRCPVSNLFIEEPFGKHRCKKTLTWGLATRATILRRNSLS